MKRIEFSGTLEQCLEMIPGIDRDFSIRKTLARLVGMSNESVYRWFRQDGNSYRPAGLARIQVGYFCETIGFEVKEVTELGGDAYHLGKLLAFSVIKLDDIATKLNANRSQVLAFLRGDHGFSEARKKVANQVANDVSLLAECQRQKGELEKSLNLLPCPQKPEVKTPSLVGQTPIQFNDACIEALGHGLRGLLPLLEIVISDDFSPEERTRVREIAGSKTVLQFSNGLVQLAGERARKDHIAQCGRRFGL